MIIDWKKVCQSPGYKSLKAAYVRDVQESERHKARFKNKPMREKKEFLRKFRWVICRATHYAAKTGSPIEEILNKWESERSCCWWLNYYQNGQQPKLHGNNLKPLGVNGYKKTLRRQGRADKGLTMRFIKFSNKSKKQPPRWKMERKKRRHAY